MPTPHHPASALGAEAAWGDNHCDENRLRADDFGLRRLEGGEAPVRPPLFQFCPPDGEGDLPLRACCNFESRISSAWAASNSCWFARPTDLDGISSKLSPALSEPSKASTSSFLKRCIRRSAK